MPIMTKYYLINSNQLNRLVLDVLTSPHFRLRSRQIDGEYFFRLIFVSYFVIRIYHSIQNEM